MRRTSILEKESKYVEEFKLKLRNCDFKQEIDLFRFKDLEILEQFKNISEELLY
jgi:hypothetical protein